MKEKQLRQAIREEIKSVLSELKNQYKIEFGPYSVELANHQVYIRKGDDLLKAEPVKRGFSVQDLRAMAEKFAKKTGQKIK